MRVSRPQGTRTQGRRPASTCSLFRQGNHIGEFARRLRHRLGSSGLAVWRSIRPVYSPLQALHHAAPRTRQCKAPRTTRRATALRSWRQLDQLLRSGVASSRRSLRATLIYPATKSCRQEALTPRGEVDTTSVTEGNQIEVVFDAPRDPRRHEPSARGLSRTRLCRSPSTRSRHKRDRCARCHHAESLPS